MHSDWAFKYTTKVGGVIQAKGPIASLKLFRMLALSGCDYQLRTGAQKFSSCWHEIFWGGLVVIVRP